MEKILAALGGRKFLFTLGIVTVGTLVELKTERGISANFVALLLGAASVFTAGNSASKLINGKYGAEGAGEESVAPPAPIINTDELHAAINGIQEQLNSTGPLLESVALSTSNTQKLIVAAISGKSS